MLLKTYHNYIKKNSALLAIVSNFFNTRLVKFEPSNFDKL